MRRWCCMVKEETVHSWARRTEFYCRQKSLNPINNYRKYHPGSVNWTLQHKNRPFLATLFDTNTGPTDAAAQLDENLSNVGQNLFLTFESSTSAEQEHVLHNAILIVFFARQSAGCSSQYSNHRAATATRAKGSLFRCFHILCSLNDDATHAKPKKQHVKLFDEFFPPCTRKVDLKITGDILLLKKQYYKIPAGDAPISPVINKIPILLDRGERPNIISEAELSTFLKTQIQTRLQQLNFNASTKTHCVRLES